MTRWLNRIDELADAYGGFVVDQFGVLHDGVRPAPGAADALLALRAAGRRVIVLSNSGKRAAANAERLAHLGVTPAHYDELITSGELLWSMLQRRDRAPLAQLGRRAWSSDPSGDRVTLQGTELELVGTPEQADFVLLAGLADVAGAADALQAPLERALRRQLPLICANPDKQRLSRRGLEPGVGALAQRYEELGGQVVWLGKPHGLIYRACSEAFAAWGVERRLAVGDSLEHDVVGGKRAGYDTCLIAGGIHAAELGTRTDAAQREARLHDLAGRLGEGGCALPDWVLPLFQ